MLRMMAASKASATRERNHATLVTPGVFTCSSKYGSQP